MKAFSKVAVLGCLLVALIATSAQVSFAQDPKADLYNKIVENYAPEWDDNDVNSLKEARAKLKIAADAGDQFVAKYTGDDDKAIVEWLNGQLPRIKTDIKNIDARIDAIVKEEAAAAKRKQLFNTFNSSHKAENWSQLFTTGDEIVKNYDNVALDVTLQLAYTAFDQVFFDDKGSYVPMAAKYAEQSINMINSGKTSKNYGVFDIYKTKAFPDGKSNALGNMHFNLGWLKFYKQGKKDEAMPHLYQATKINSSRKNYNITYTTIGTHYTAGVQKLIDEQNALLAARKNEVDKDDPDPEAVKMIDYKLDLRIAMMKGFASRAIDAYLRAYGTLNSEQKNAEFGKKMFTYIQELYKVRYPKDAALKSPEKINSDLAAVNTKAMPDPQSKVMPIGAPLKPAPKPATTEGTTGETRSRTVSGNNR